MDETRSPARRRLRRLTSAALAGLIALGGGIALAVVAGADAANAVPGDVFFTTPEGTPIPHSPFQFDGEASPGDAITITSSYGSDCHAIANPLGVWSCDMFFTDSVETTVITVSRDVDDGNATTQDSDGQEHHIALPLAIAETSADEYRSNNSPARFSGTGAIPGVNITGTIGVAPCSGVAAGDGSWTCTGPFLADGSYVSTVRQDAGSVISDASITTYVADTTTFMPTIDAPYDSTAAPVDIQTSRRQPTFVGDPGSAEPGATVHLLVSDFGTSPIIHSGTPAFDQYCLATVQSNGSWSCNGAVLTIGHFYEVSVFAVDDLGNVGPSPDDEFGIEILPPPDAPVVVNPQPNFGELPPFVANGTVDAVTTSVRIRDGATDLCGVIIPAGLNWSCPGVGIAPGPHTLSFDAFDMYGTSTTTTVSVLSWADPTVTTPTPGMLTSRSPIHVKGSAPIGSDLSVRIDGSGFLGCAILPVAPTFDCQTGFLGLGPHTVDVDFTDPWGTNSTTVTRLITIVPTLPAPVFTAPSLGYTSANRSVHVAVTNAAEGRVYVRDGLFNLCPPTSVATDTYSCTTSQLSVGVHTITISQTDQYGVMSASAQRTVTILPTPGLPLTRKVFGFEFTVLDQNGVEVGTDGLGTGDMVTVVASHVPPGTLVRTEIHSNPIALGQMTVGQSGLMQITTIVPAIEPGSHEIVVGATAPGYWPASFAAPLQVHGLKQIPGETGDIVKQLGEPEPVKQLGTPVDETGTGTDAGSGGAGGAGQHGFADPSVFGSSVVSPLDSDAHAFALSPAGIVLSGSIAIAFLLLVGFPAELLESTIRTNYDTAFGWLGRVRRRMGKIVAPVGRALASPWVGGALTILGAAFLLGFADPDFGFNGASVRLMLAMIVSVLTINVGLALIVMRVAGRAFDTSAVLKPMPAALLLVGVSVLVSRFLGISPGFLFGVVLGVAYARELRLRDEARLGVLGVGLTIAAGLLAWLGYGLVRAIASGEGFFNNLVIEVLAAITLEALGTLVIALLPIEFLDGRTIFRWSKLAWGALYALTAVVFLFVVVPLSDNWGTMSAPMLGWGSMFAAFAVVAVVTWVIFQRRPKSPTPSSPEAAAPRQRARR